MRYQRGCAVTGRPEVTELRLVGHRAAGHIRVAFGVSDAAAATAHLAAAGATVIAQPVPTPWQSLNARLDGPAGLQLTLFSDLPQPGANA